MTSGTLGLGSVLDDERIADDLRKLLHRCRLTEKMDGHHRFHLRAHGPLHRLGVERVVMLSGDHPRTARALARELGIDDVRAGLRPEDKVVAIRQLEREHGAVAMIGDGVNDAPALAAATIGIAMGTAGSDAAIEAADVALMADDLEKAGKPVKDKLKPIRHDMTAGTVLLGNIDMWHQFVHHSHMVPSHDELRASADKSIPFFQLVWP